MASARSMRLSRSVFSVAGKTLFSPLPRSVSSTPLSSIIPSSCSSTCSTCCCCSSCCRYGITMTTNSVNACNSTAWVDMGFRRQFHSSTPSQFSAGSSGQINQMEFTDLAWEGIIGAVDAALMSKQQVVESEHLMKALLEQKDGLARRILAKAGIDSTSVLQATDQFIAQQPKVLVDTSCPVMGSHLKTLLDNARKYQKELGDDFVSVEHFMLAFLPDKRFGQQLLKNLQLGEKEL